MHRITIGFSRPKNKPFPLFSWIIRAVEMTPYSHVYLSWESISGVEVVYEASGTSVSFINKKIFEEKASTLYEFTFDIDRTAYRKLIAFTMTNAGVDYGIKQIIGIGLVKLFKLKKNPFSDGRASQVCSETVAYFLEQILGHQLDFDKDIAGPKDIYRFLEKQRNN